MYKISSDKISVKNALLVTSTTLPTSRYKWKIVMNHRTGGKIREWNIGAENVPIQSFNFELAEKGCMGAKINFPKIDFSLYYGNEILIYYNGEKRYRGYVESIADPKGDNITISPFHKRLNEITFNNTFTNQSFLSILSTTLNANDDVTGVFYNASMVGNYDSTEVFTEIKYEYEKIQKLIEDHYQVVDDIYWGVEENGFLYLKKRSTAINYYIYSGSNQPYQELNVKKDYAKIKATRYNIFQKTTGSETAFIATIPNGTTTYPYLSLETETGIKYEKLTAPAGLNSTECKDFAMAKLNAMLVPENIKIKGMDITRYDLKIGQRIKIYDITELQQYNFIDCDSTNNWQGTLTLDSADFVKGDASIQSNGASEIIYRFDEEKHCKELQGIIFMAKSNLSDKVLEINTKGSLVLTSSTGGVLESSSGSTLYSAEVLNKIKFKGNNVWEEIKINTTHNDLPSIRFNFRASSAVEYKLDDIRGYGYFQNSYEGNVIKLGYDINNENDNLYDVEIGDYDPMANDALFALQKKIDILEKNQQEST